MSTEVVDDPDRSRYEIHVDGELAGFAVYARRANRVIFVHTEVEPGFEGKGIGSALAKGALDDTRRRLLRVVPLCPFITSYIDRHQDFADLVDTQMLSLLDHDA